MSSRNKPPRQKYEIYRTRRSLLANSARELSKGEPDLKRLVKREADDSLTRHLIATQPDMAFAIDGLIMAEEMLWESQGKHVIFPQSADFISRLLGAKYDLSQVGGFELPFPSFMLPIPKGFEVDRVPLGGVLVTSYQVKDTSALLDRYSRFLKRPMNPRLMRELGIDEQYCQNAFTTPIDPIKSMDTRISPDDDLLCVLLLDDHKNLLHSSIIRGSETYTRIPDLLSATTPEEFHNRLGPMHSSSYAARGLSPRDATLEFYAFRIVCSLAVYNMATNGDLLTTGLPGGQLPHMVGKFDPKGTANFNIGCSSTITDIRASGAHYRQWHFRQLRDKRYYQGEHACKPIGSRWVFVNDSMVGERNTESYTLSEANSN